MKSQLYFDVADAATARAATTGATSAAAPTIKSAATAAATATNLQHKLCPHDETIFNYLLQ